MASTDFEDNTEEFKSEINKALEQALEEIGLTAEGYAKLICPVDTGRLRNSITHEVDADENVVYIGTNVEYAAPVELGVPPKRRAQPYLRPAAENHADEYKRIIESRLKGQN